MEIFRLGLGSIFAGIGGALLLASEEISTNEILSLIMIFMAIKFALFDYRDNS